MFIAPNGKRRKGSGASAPVLGSVQDIGHVVDDSLLLGDDPSRCEDGSADEDLPGVGLVADLDALGVPDEHDGVVPDDVPAADGVDADLVSAGADAFASVDDLLAAHLLADDLGGGHGGTAGGVLLLVVVGLDDLHVVGVAEVVRGLLDELEEHSDTDGVVGRDDRCDVVPYHGFCDVRLLLGCESGGTDDEVDSRIGGGRCVDRGGCCDGEVDEDIGLGFFQDVPEVLGVGNGYVEGSHAYDLSDILSDVDEVERGGDLHALGGEDAADDERTHPSAGSQYGDPRAHAEASDVIVMMYADVCFIGFCMESDL